MKQSAKQNAIYLKLLEGAIMLINWIKACVMDQLTDELRYGLIKLHPLTENMLKNELYTGFGAREYLLEWSLHPTWTKPVFVHAQDFYSNHIFDN